MKMKFKIMFLAISFLGACSSFTTKLSENRSPAQLVGCGGDQPFCASVEQGKLGCGGENCDPFGYQCIDQSNAGTLVLQTVDSKRYRVSYSNLAGDSSKSSGYFDAYRGTARSDSNQWNTSNFYMADLNSEAFVHFFVVNDRLQASLQNSASEAPRSLFYCCHMSTPQSDGTCLKK